MTRVSFHQGLEKDLRKLPPRIRQRFFKAIKQLESNPLLGMSLSGEFKGNFKLRLGDYRIVYEFFPSKHVIIIYRMEIRGSAYKK